MDDICEVCGNDREPGSLVCKYCGVQYERQEKNAGRLHRIINLELGRPQVEVAINKLESEIKRAKTDNIAILTIIHGYGSSGEGGVIRDECRKILRYFEEKNRIRSMIIGESFSKKEGRTKALLRRFPHLGSDRNLNRSNKGVTLVEL